MESEIRGLQRLLTVALKLDQLIDEVDFGRRAAAIVARTNRLFFQQNGVLWFLRLSARGEIASTAERRRLRAEHSSFETEVEQAAERLRTESRLRDVRLGLEAMALLEGVVEDRTAIRDSIDGMLKSHDAEGRREDAAFILARLEALAPRFAEAEARLRARVAARREAARAAEDAAIEAELAGMEAAEAPASAADDRQTVTEAEDLRAARTETPRADKPGRPLPGIGRFATS